MATQSSFPSGSAASKGTSPERVRSQALPFYLPNLCDVHALFPLILIGQLFALIFSLIKSPLPVFDWYLFSLLSIEILWIVLIGAAILCPLRPLLMQLHAQQGVLLCFMILLLVISVVSAAGQWLLAQTGIPVTRPFWAVFQHVGAGGVISGLVLRYFYLQQQLHQQQQLQLEVQMQARFQALQSRIRPHFLFNSMNIISSLIATDPDTAEQVVEDLSTLFRASLGNAEDMVPLSHELDLCKRYIHIEQLRLGERLQVNWHLSLHNAQHPVPALCLQPLVENAIYHGIQPRLEGGVIDITITDDLGRLAVSISNPFDEQPAGTPPGHRGNAMALNNLEQRLLSRYGDSARFSVTRAHGIFAVDFSLPSRNTPGDTATP